MTDDSKTDIDLRAALIGAWRSTDCEHTLLVLYRDSFNYTRPLNDCAEHELTTFKGRAFLRLEYGGRPPTLHLVTESISQWNIEREMPTFYENLTATRQLEHFLYHEEVSGTTAFTFDNSYHVSPGDGDAPTRLEIISSGHNRDVSFYFFEKVQVPAYMLPSGSVVGWYDGSLFELPAQATPQLMYSPAGSDEQPAWEPPSVTMGWEDVYPGSLLSAVDDASLTYAHLVFGESGWEISNPHARIQGIESLLATDGRQAGELYRYAPWQTRITWLYADRNVYIGGHTDHGEADLELKTGWNRVVRTRIPGAHIDSFRIGAEPEGAFWEVEAAW